MQDLDIGILTPHQEKLQNQGRNFLKLFCSQLPEITPLFYGNHDPVNREFKLENLGEIVKYWDKCFFWKSKRMASEGRVWMDRKNTHSSIYISGKSKLINCNQVVDFFLQSTLLLEPDFAYIHLFSKEELNAAHPDADIHLYDALMPFRQGVVTHELREYLPNLCWGTVLGSPYVELFGRENILCAPVPIIKELPYGAIYLQLSERLEDLQKNYQKIDDTRQLVKRHLDCQAFLDPKLGIHHNYNVPEFQLG
jgi:hypothetical protein